MWNKDRNLNYLVWAIGKMVLLIIEVGKSVDEVGLVEVGLGGGDESLVLDISGLMGYEIYIMGIMKFYFEIDLCFI